MTVGGCETQSITYSQKSPEFLLTMPLSPLALNLWNTHSGFKVLNTIDHWGCGAVGYVCCLSMLDFFFFFFYRLETTYLSICAWEDKNSSSDPFRPLFIYLGHTQGVLSLSATITTQVSKHWDPKALSKGRCVLECTWSVKCVFQRKIGKNGEESQRTRRWKIEMHISSMITGNNEPPPLRLKTHRSAHSRKEKLCFVPSFHFSLNTILPQSAENVRRRRRREGKGKQKQNKKACGENCVSVHVCVCLAV